MTMQAQLNAYRDAFNGRDLAAVLTLFGEQALFEMPLLGQRLVGKREIAAGLNRIYEVTESIRLEVSKTKMTDRLVIAEGWLRARLYRDPQPVEIPLAVVLESTQQHIMRLSNYLDARPYRLWADGTLFAAAHVSTES